MKHIRRRGVVEARVLEGHQEEAQLLRLRELLWSLGHDLGDLYAESGQTVQGSFSAVSKTSFAAKYSLEGYTSHTVVQ